MNWTHWTKDKLFATIIDKLTKLGINSQLVNSSNAYSNMFNFRFTIKQGHFITVEILETHIYEIIAKAIVRKNSDKYSYFDVNPRNIDDWIYNEYSKLHADEREKAKKKSSFAGGYAQYDPNDHKGFGSQKQWQEEFKKATGNKGFKDEDGHFWEFDDYGAGAKKQEFKFDFEGFSFEFGKDFEDFIRGFKHTTGGHNKNQSQTKSPPPPPKPDSPRVLLGVSLEGRIPEDVLKKAWRSKCMEWHPDRNQHRVTEATAMIQKINDAYNTLKSSFGYK